MPVVLARPARVRAAVVWPAWALVAWAQAGVAQVAGAVWVQVALAVWLHQQHRLQKAAAQTPASQHRIAQTRSAPYPA